MRTKHALMIVACLAAGLMLAPMARPQDGGIQPYYWPLRTVGIPVNLDRINKEGNKPSELQLYYSYNHGQLQKGPRLAVNHLQTIDAGKNGFLFNSERDGDYEFAVQWIFADGTTSPSTDQLTGRGPQYRIIVDTTPPVIRLNPISSGVEWVVTDDNLDPHKIVLKCRWPGSRDWLTIKDREFQPVDRYVWPLTGGKVLEVRLEAEDRAANKTVSQPVRVSADGATATGMPRAAAPTPGPGWVGSANPGLPAPRIEYVNTLKFDVDYAIQRMGRSGIQAAHLFVLRSQGTWDLVKRFPVKLSPTDKDQSLSLPYEAKEEGTYGFYVIPESGAGKRAPDPRKEDQPLVWVVVDTTAPYIKITGANVAPGPRGPTLEITWEAVDPNLMPQPVSLEWSTDKNADKWNEIKYRLDNLPGSTKGRYLWEIPEDNHWKFWIRARAVDKASNTGESIWPQEVVVDLEQPSAGIVKVRGGNSTSGPTSLPSRVPGGSDAPLPPSVPSSPGAPSVPSVPTIPQSPSSSSLPP